MVRTRADNSSIKAVASKAPRKLTGGSSSSSGSSSYSDSPSRIGGPPLVNHAKIWPTPKWQKGIGHFFSKKEKSLDEEPCSSAESTEPLSTTNDERIDEDCAIVNEPTVPTVDLVEGNSEEVLQPIDDLHDSDENKENVEPCSSGTSSCSNESPSSSSTSPTRKQKGGKEKAPKSNKKRRVVRQLDSSDEEE